MWDGVEMMCVRDVICKRCGDEMENVKLEGSC